MEVRILWVTRAGYLWCLLHNTQGVRCGMALAREPHGPLINGE